MRIARLPAGFVTAANLSIPSTRARAFNAARTKID
jgi:hypothetical protein